MQPTMTNADGPHSHRLKRSGARNVQVRTPKSIGGEIDILGDTWISS